MSSEVKKPSPFFFYISDNYNQYSKIRWGDYEGMKSKSIFELLKKKPKFHSNTSLCSIIYKTPTFTLPLPDDLVPLDVFPELRYKLEIKPKVFDEAPVEESHHSQFHQIIRPMEMEVHKKILQRIQILLRKKTRKQLMKQ